jgi:AraC-like DNA-binding protein
MSLFQPDTTTWDRSSGRRGYERETFEGPTSLLPELGIFGWLRFHSALAGALKPDRHPDAIEIHYMVRGHLHWQVEEEHCEFSTGRVFIIRPNELHSGGEGSIQPCEHYWLRFGFPEQRPLPGMTVSETRSLREGYENIKYRTFAVSREVNEFFEQMLEIHRQAQTPVTPVTPLKQSAQPLAQLLARSLFHALLITILRDHNRHCQLARQKPLVSRRVRQTLEWLEGQIYETDLRLEGLAANVGLSPTGLRMRFKAETGYTLHEYLIERRLQEARRRLTETNDDITTIAHELGFSSGQYFATVFSRQIGMTPGDYRKSHQHDFQLESNPGVENPGPDLGRRAKPAFNPSND